MRLTRDQDVRFELPDTTTLRLLGKPWAMVVVAVHGHVPPRKGAVSFEVELACGLRKVTIGNAAVFPALPFTPADTGKIQRFQFGWPFDKDCLPARRLTLRLIAEGGDGDGASFDIESIELVTP